MSDKLIKYFETVNIYLTSDETKYFKNANLIYPITFNATSNFSIIKIQLEDFLPIELVEKIELQLKTNNFLPTKFSFQVKNRTYTKELIWNYINYIRNNKAEYKTGAVALLNIELIDFDLSKNQLIIKAQDKMQKELLLEHKEYYSKKISKYGFENLSILITEQKIDKNLINEINESYKSVTNKYNKENKDLENELFSDKSISDKPKNSSNSNYKFKSINLDVPTYSDLSLLEQNAVNVIIHGKISKIDIIVSKNSGRKIYNVTIQDEKSAVSCTMFAKDFKSTYFDKPSEELILSEEWIKEKDNYIAIGDWIALSGDFKYSDYVKEYIFYYNKYTKISKVENFIKDNSVIKRVELHTHTKMSVMDGVSSVSEYIKTADKWGWDAIAITDHLNVQCFPEAAETISKINSKREKPLKLIYGSEVTVIDNNFWYVKNDRNKKLNESRFVIFDLETTGLSPERDEIIEFGAVIYDYQNGTRVKKDFLIKPKNPINKFTTDLTNITNEQLEDKPSIEEIFPQILEIIKDSVLIAHNANFDFNFLQSYCKKLGYETLNNTVIDTLSISRALIQKLKNHRLGTVCRYFQIQYDEKEAHRADYDADVLTNLFEHLWRFARKKFEINTDSDWNNINPVNRKENGNFTRQRGFHLNILVKNQAGIKDLYKIISRSHVQNYLNGPKMFKEDILEFKKNNNILIGSGCINGWVFETLRTGTEEMIREAISFFDYIEIQPISVYKHMFQVGDYTEEQVKNMLKDLIKICKELNKIIVATSDAHYTTKDLKKIREVYINSKGLGGANHPLFDFRGRVTDYPDQHMRTTEEMLKEFEWLDDKKLIEELVITNTNLIASQVEDNIQALKKGNFPPIVKDSDKLLSELCYQTAKQNYGEILPKIVEDRLKKELNSIIKHGFAVVYWISHLLVKQSLDDGYLVGSRGSVGSSFVATMSGITEVNPLKAHYKCNKCLHSEFETPNDILCGYDLPEKKCPKCENILSGEGHDIPFETFLGFDGDKVPDIDLNFSGEYQPEAHNFTKRIFGEKNVFRAGTISTVAEKTAYGYVMAYLEKTGENNLRRAEIDMISEKVADVKRTTGQHPGGIIILPSDMEIEDFTPVNYPADDSTSAWLTTHFDFHSIHDNLLKMDILGHVDPTALRMLKDLTGIDPINIPVNDPKVYSLFSNTISIGSIEPEKINKEKTGAIALPEFGTGFVRSMLNETKPKNFADLVQISGLSHGTDVYIGNARELIKEKLATISTVIGCRDDIMVYLMNKGIDPSTSFNIMESVRKGKGLTKKWQEIMKENNVPDWYIQSCLKIKYMFPKAHATAYVLMAYRVAWFKVYYPEEFYATFFSTRINQFDLEAIIYGEEEVRKRINFLNVNIEKNIPLTAKERDLYSVYEVLLEMYSRGVKIQNIDFNLSDSMKFLVKEINGIKTIIPPFNTIESLGEAVANSIVEARKIRAISSVGDLKLRTQVTQTQLSLFDKFNILDTLADEEQLKFEF